METLGIPRRGGARVADRLSELPDCILEHVLSYLTTRQAALTSALSRRWRHLWRAVTRTCVDIDQSEFSEAVTRIESHDDAADSAMDAMTKRIYRQMEQWEKLEDLADLLTMQEASWSPPPLERFRLRVSYAHFLDARRWIRRGLERRPASLSLSLRVSGRRSLPVASGEEMPSLVAASLRRSSAGILCSLRHARSLDLTGFSAKALLVDVPAFRNLRILVLNACELGADCQVLRRFLRDAPSLEAVTLRDCTLSSGGSGSSERNKASSDDRRGPAAYYPCKNLRSIEIESKPGHEVVDEVANVLRDISKEMVDPFEWHVQEGKLRFKLSFV